MEQLTNNQKRLLAIREDVYLTPNKSIHPIGYEEYFYNYEGLYEYYFKNLEHLELFFNENTRQEAETLCLIKEYKDGVYYTTQEPPYEPDGPVCCNGVRMSMAPSGICYECLECGGWCYSSS